MNILYLALVTVVYGQTVNEEHPRLGEFELVLDANWRWVHDIKDPSKNCFKSNKWTCRDDDCDENCIVEGVTLSDYKEKYGVDGGGGSGGKSSSRPANSITLQFVTGSNVGSRLYLIDKNTKRYWFPNLINKQLTLDIDVSNVPCSVNSAIYLVEMNKGDTDLDGLGIGYGDAQCPTDIKYLTDASANVDKKKRCENEIDIVEANNQAMAWTLHPCTGKDNENCDRSGADANSYRQGFKDFYGKGKKVDTNKPFTVITQFIGDPIKEVKRFYKQNGVVLEHPAGSLTSESIQASFDSFDEENEFEKTGGFKALTECIKRGMSVVVSIWDDVTTHMTWLDSEDRGPCKPNLDVRKTNPDSSVVISNFKLEDIGEGLEQVVTDGEDSTELKYITSAKIPSPKKIKKKVSSKVKTDSVLAPAEAAAPAPKRKVGQKLESASKPETDAKCKSEDPFCCFASENTNDVCNTCYPSAKQFSDEWCGKSEKRCVSCSSVAVWCD